MKHAFWMIAYALLLTVPFLETVAGAQRGTVGRGGTAAPAPTPPPGEPRIPVRIQVVISRYEGDRKVSSLPYTVATGTGTQASLRMGTRVPVRGTAPADGKQPSPVSFVDVGTNLDVTATPAEGGRFRLQVIMVESSVLDGMPLLPKANLAPGHAVFGNFSYTGSLMLRDGETQQVVSSINRATGETIKLDVTLTVEK